MPAFRSALSSGTIAVVLLFAEGTARAATPPAAPAHPDMQQFGVGARIKLHTANHERMEGTILSIGEESLSILPKGKAKAVTLPLAEITSAHEHAPLGSRFRLGPCIGPVTVAIASPFILGAYLSGH